MDAIFAAVDFKTVAAAVGVIGVAVIGIHMAFKGIDLGKRGVKRPEGRPMLIGALLALFLALVAVIGAVSALVFALQVRNA